MSILSRNDDYFKKLYGNVSRNTRDELDRMSGVSEDTIKHKNNLEDIELGDSDSDYDDYFGSMFKSAKSELGLDNKTSNNALGDSLFDNYETKKQDGRIDRQIARNRANGLLEPKNTSSNSNNTTNTEEEKKPFYKKIPVASDIVGGLIGGVAGAGRTYAEWDYKYDMRKAERYKNLANNQNLTEERRQYYQDKYEKEVAQAEFWREENIKTAEKMLDYADSFSTVKADDNMLVKATKGAFGSLGNIATATIAGGGNGIIGMGVSTYGQSLKEAQEMNLTEEDTHKYALSTAFIESGSELLFPGAKGIKTFLTTGSIKQAVKEAGVGSTKEFIKQVGVEFGQEAGTEVLNIINERRFEDKDGNPIATSDWRELGERIMVAGLSGAIMGGVTEGAGRINKANNNQTQNTVLAQQEDTTIKPETAENTVNQTNITAENANKAKFLTPQAQKLNNAFGFDVSNLIEENINENAKTANSTSEIANNAISEANNNPDTIFKGKSIDAEGNSVYVKEDGTTINSKLFDLFAESNNIDVNKITRLSEAEMQNIAQNESANALIETIEDSVMEEGAEATVKSLNESLNSGAIDTATYNTAVNLVNEINTELNTATQQESVQDNTTQHEATQNNAETLSNKAKTIENAVNTTNIAQQEATQSNTTQQEAVNVGSTQHKATQNNTKTGILIPNGITAEQLDKAYKQDPQLKSRMEEASKVRQNAEAKLKEAQKEVKKQADTVNKIDEKVNKSKTVKEQEKAIRQSEYDSYVKELKAKQQGDIKKKGKINKKLWDSLTESEKLIYNENSKRIDSLMSSIDVYPFQKQKDSLKAYVKMAVPSDTLMVDTKNNTVSKVAENTENTSSENNILNSGVHKAVFNAVKNLGGVVRVEITNDGNTTIYNKYGGNQTIDKNNNVVERNKDAKIVKTITGKKAYSEYYLPYYEAERNSTTKNIKDKLKSDLIETYKAIEKTTNPTKIAELKNKINELLSNSANKDGLLINEFEEVRAEAKAEAEKSLLKEDQAEAEKSWAEEAYKEYLDKVEKLNKVVNGKDFKAVFTNLKLEVIEKLTVKQDAVNQLGKAIGREVIFFNANSENAPTGFMKNNIIFLNGDYSGSAMTQVLGHETFHTLKTTNKETFNQLIEYGKENFTAEEITQFLSKIDNEAEVNKLKNNPDLLSEEMLAEAFGNDFANKEFWKGIEKKNKSLFEKIKDIIAKIFNRAKSYKTDFLTQKHIDELRVEFESIFGVLTQNPLYGEFAFNNIAESLQNTYREEARASKKRNNAIQKYNDMLEGIKNGEYSEAEIEQLIKELEPIVNKGEFDFEKWMDLSDYQNKASKIADVKAIAEAHGKTIYELTPQERYLYEIVSESTTGAFDVKSVKFYKDGSMLINMAHPINDKDYTTIIDKDGNKVNKYIGGRAIKTINERELNYDFIAPIRASKKKTEVKNDVENAQNTLKSISDTFMKSKGENIKEIEEAQANALKKIAEMNGITDYKLSQSQELQQELKAVINGKEIILETGNGIFGGLDLYIGNNPRLKADVRATANPYSELFKEQYEDIQTALKEVKETKSEAKKKNLLKTETFVDEKGNIGTKYFGSKEVAKHEKNIREFSNVFFEYRRIDEKEKASKLNELKTVAEKALGKIADVVGAKNTSVEIVNGKYNSTLITLTGALPSGDILTLKTNNSSLGTEVNYCVNDKYIGALPFFAFRDTDIIADFKDAINEAISQNSKPEKVLAPKKKNNTSSKKAKKDVLNGYWQATADDVGVGKFNKSKKSIEAINNVIEYISSQFEGSSYEVGEFVGALKDTSDANRRFNIDFGNGYTGYIDFYHKYDHSSMGYMVKNTENGLSQKGSIQYKDLTDDNLLIDKIKRSQNKIMVKADGTNSNGESISKKTQTPEKVLAPKKITKTDENTTSAKKDYEKDYTDNEKTRAFKETIKDFIEGHKQAFGAVDRTDIEMAFSQEFEYYQERYDFTPQTIEKLINEQLKDMGIAKIDFSYIYDYEGYVERQYKAENDDVKFATRKGKEFDNWFKGSVMVKGNGSPEVYYHRTDSVFDDFNDNAETVNGKMFGAGHYFAFNAPPSRYGTNELTVNLNLKSPFYDTDFISADVALKMANEIESTFGLDVVDDVKARIEDNEIYGWYFLNAIKIKTNNTDMRGLFKKYGYDGLVIRESMTPQIVAFYNEQVNIAETNTDLSTLKNKLANIEYSLENSTLTESQRKYHERKRDTLRDSIARLETEDDIRFSTRSKEETAKITAPLQKVAQKTNNLQLRAGIHKLQGVKVDKNVDLVGIFNNAIDSMASNSESTKANIKTLKNALMEEGISSKEANAIAKYFTNIIDVAKETYAETTPVSKNVITSSSYKGKSKGIKAKTGEAFDSFYTHIVDTNHAGKMVNDVFYNKAKTTKNSFGVVDNIFTEALTDKNGNIVDNSMKEMFSNVFKADDITEFMDYALHKHNISRALQGKYVFFKEDGSPMKSTDSAKIVKQYEAKHSDFASRQEELTGWINTFMETWAVDTGLMSKDFHSMLKEMYNHYVPTNRSFADHEELFGGGYSGKGFVDKSKPTKRAEKGGSARDIIDLQESLVNLVAKTVRTAKMNEVGQELVKAIQSNAAMKGIAEIVDKPDINVDNVVRVLVEGEPVFVEVHNKQLLEMLEQVHTPEFHAVIEASKKSLNVVKQLITSKNPLFAITNTFRDYQTYMINSTEANVFKRWGSIGKALKAIKNNTKEYQLYKAMGISSSGIMAKNNTKTVQNITGLKSIIDKDTGALLGKKDINDSKDLQSRFLKGWNKFNEAIETLTGTSETTFRLAEFINSLDRGLTVDEATANAMEITVDFSRSGDYTRFADTGVMYLNAGVQGLDKVARQVKKHPIQSLTRSMVHIAAPAILLSAINGGDDDYEMLDSRTKDNNFLIPLWLFGGEEGKFLKLPKAREYGVVAMICERLIYGKGEEGSFDNLWRSVKENMAPADVFADNIISDINKAKDNEARDFAGRYIVPKALQSKEDKDQWDDDTTVLAKHLGQLLNFSPKKIDYYLDHYTGIVGDLLMPLLTPSTYASSDSKDAVSNILAPITKKFVADNAYSSSATSKYYDNLDELKNIIDKEQEGLTTAEKRALTTETEAFKSAVNEVYGNDISDLNEMLKDNSLSNSEKRRVRKARNEAMKQANEAIKKFLSPKSK